MGAPLVDSWPSAALCRKTLHVCATLKDGLAQLLGSAGPDRTGACAVVHKRMGSPAVVGAMHPRRDSATDTCPARAAPPPAACGRCPPAHQPNSIEDRVVGCLRRCGVSARSSTKMAPWRCPPWRARATHELSMAPGRSSKPRCVPVWPPSERSVGGGAITGARIFDMPISLARNGPCVPNLVNATRDFSWGNVSPGRSGLQRRAAGVVDHVRGC